MLGVKKLLMKIFKIINEERLTFLIVCFSVISFGILSTLNISFYLGLVSFIVSFYIIYLLKKSKKKTEKVSLSLILGGALGNGVDRVTREYVIDFIDISFNSLHWPAFAT